MACPYFYPTARLENGSWVIPPRMPLGDAYAGECRAGAEAFRPDEARLREHCNTGYGRGSCEQFPVDASVDAVRFHLCAESEGLIRIQYVLEKDCWPVSSGALECSQPVEICGNADTILTRQAASFVESYLRRRDQALAIGV
jgi:hypothetical protein